MYIFKIQALFNCNFGGENMTKTSFNLDNRPEHFFETAQEARLWFCFCESTPKVRMQNHSDWSYCCEPSDVAIVVKKLL